MNYGFADELLLNGKGEFGNNELAVIVRSGNGSRALAYLPTQRTVTLSDPLRQYHQFRWINASDGREVMAKPDKAGALSPPDTGDWLLVME